MKSLLPRALPFEWSEGNTVLWYPEDRNHSHPPRGWIRVVWRYLQNCFADAGDILSLGKLPLLPLNMSKTPVTMARLCEPSRVVVKHFYGHYLDDDVSDILVKLGVLIMTDYPSFIGHHPAVLGRFVHPPSVQGVLKAMVVSSSMMTNGKLFEIVRIVLSTKEKQLLRSFLVNIKCKQLYQMEYDVLCSLPVFETLAKKFVSAKEGLRAAPPEPLPITLGGDLVDVSQDDSMALARLLGVKILTPVELLCQVVFPDIKRGCYSEEQIDKLMEHVLDRYASAFRKNACFKRNLQDLAFVSRQKGRARPCELFDPRNVIIKNLFVHEDVFPSFTYGSPSVLVILEELGMKGEDDVTATDLYQSAKMISKFPNLPSLKEKSKIIVRFLNEDPQKMLDLVSGQQLWILLRTIPWVSRQEQRPHGYPPSLPYWKTEEEENRRFFKPVELKSHQFANLIGTVMPVVDVDKTETISQFFGWQDEPRVNQVVQHLETAVRCYSQVQKPYYIVMLAEIYRFLGEYHHDVDEEFEAINVFPWVWNGDGFSLPSHLLATRPSIDLAPYIRCLPVDFRQHCRLFEYFGMQRECDPSVLVKVLRMIKVKHDSGSVMSPSEVKHDLQLSVNILNELASGELSEALQGDILIPTYQEDNSYVRLQPVDSCMYGEQNDDEEIDYFYVHPNVPNVTAERLGVPSITNRLLDADELAIGEEFGQGEKLTTRLNRLLEEYTDGFSVLKELIQNADDAGATEVKFLYDERTNEEAMTCLIDEGMKGCQGPALWVYNDATFKEEDFENITKLNEATKQHDTEKIGRFGLGFNAVYNLTDVPMFISRNSFVIFDPHTSYLGKALKNKTKPGMKINVNKDVSRLRKFKNQFKPFNGIFGCDLNLQKEDNSFNGTLFRFPLRTSEQALKSEIKKLAYDDTQMRELLLMLIKGAETLLIFTQNVLRVSIFSLTTPEVQDETVKLMFKVTKSLSQEGIVRALSVPVSLPPTANILSYDDQNFLKQCSFLQASSRVIRAFRKGRVIELTKSSLKVNVHCVFTECGLRFFKPDAATIHPECTTWLIVSSMGDGLALKFAENDFSLLPSGGVAVQLAVSGADKFLPVPVFKNDDGIDVNGTLFCYLPLPIHSGLPVHINGAFALAANRRHLQEKLEGDKDCYGVYWNKALIVDSICSAYVCLLEDLRSITPTDGSYRFHSLWPKADEVFPNLRNLTQSFYTQISTGDHALFSDGENWFTINEVVLLHPVLRHDPSIGDTSFKVFQLLMSERAVVIDLPSSVVNSFQRCGSGEVINSKIYDKNRFFRQVFFPSISAVPSEMRDMLVLHAMDNNCDDLVKAHSCIPASPLGNSLTRPSELIHPGKDAARLFLPEDGRFPCGNAETFLNPRRLAKLELLGMASDYLPWQEMAERAESIHRLNAVNSEVAFKRVKEFLRFLERKIKYFDEPLPDSVRKRMLEARFIPVQRKPKNFPLKWKSEEYKNDALLAPKDVFAEEEKYLLCCAEPLIGVFVSPDVKALLNLNKKHANLDHIAWQLKQALSSNVASLDLSAMEEINTVCKALYLHLQNAISRNGAAVKELLKDKKFILCGRKFLYPDQLAFQVSDDCSPYLYQLPKQLAEDFPKLMRFAGVREHFEEKDFISSLHQMRGQFSENELDEENLRVAVRLANQLGETLRSIEGNPAQLEEKWGTIYLPDSRAVMKAVSELCFKDCPWMPDEEGVHFVHAKIPWSSCDLLGVKTRREEALQKHMVRISFGQKEKLTTRLKRILQCYPCEKEILKELLQNADDAQATEICFIKDPRHHPDVKVFEDCWKPLQGPALCVYNNKPFTNDDLEGIQTLGEGSKGEDPNKTGQYGVGFNAVYHLTDVPSFVSQGEEIGDVLCVFDPHCKYLPGATPLEPGGRFNDTATLRKKFPDIFPCYLPDHFKIDNATMFRFPLRNKEMTRDSKISSNCVSVKELDFMIEGLKKELFEVLLFVKNVRKITLCEVDKASGKLANSYTVEAALSKEDEAKRKAFTDCIKQIGKSAKEKGGIDPRKILVKKVSYVLDITDTDGNAEKWLIVQKVGFEKDVEESILNAFRRQELGMLPRGGVACLLERHSRYTSPRQKKAYCFLPLPLETNLPVHVNGHFALDHEARRSLWRDEGDRGGYRSDWNNALLTDVVASCYISMLVEVQKFLKLPTVQDASPQTECEIISKLNVYESYFPIKIPSDQYWKTLVHSVYQEMNKMEAKVLPVVKKRSLNGASKITEESATAEITWLPPTGIEKHQAFFDDLNVEGPFAASHGRSKEAFENPARLRKLFKDILLESGFNLVVSSLALHNSFQRAGVTTCCVSPRKVIDFYKTLSSGDRLCSIGPVPCDVHKTSLKSVLGVTTVLLYCRNDENFLEALPGLPLLLTQDQHLKLFSNEDPKFLSQYKDLLPGSPHIFLHDEVYKRIFKGFDDNRLSCLRPLDATSFATYLPHTLSLETYGSGRFIEWSPNQREIPNRGWIFKAWIFLSELVNGIMNDAKKDGELKTHQVQTTLEPLMDWSILPVTETKKAEGKSLLAVFFRMGTTPTIKHYLLPLRKAAFAIDFTTADSSNAKLVDVLRKVGLPELNVSVFSSTSVHTSLSSNSVSLVCMLVSSLKSPSSILISLNHKMESDEQSLEGKLEPQECLTVLEYFSRSERLLGDDDRVTLRRLPFYLATHGGLIRLNDRKVYVLPVGIPRDGIDVLESELNIVFLEQRSSISELFKFLSLHCFSAIDFYCTFILPNFSIFCKGERESHLTYIRKTILDYAEDDEKEKLLNCLKNTPFVPSVDGSLKTASSFYDPRNSVFRIMLSVDLFPAKPFDSGEWLTFLKSIGLVCHVSKERFRAFATEVAREAASAPSDITFKKSSVLVDHLMNRKNVIAEGLLQDVYDIPFVAGDPVKESLQEICLPFGGYIGCQTPYFAFQGAVPVSHSEIVWTNAHLLPGWANPKNRSSDLRNACPPKVNLNSYCNAFVSQLQIQNEPTVDLVVAHCQNICSQVGKNSAKTNASKERCLTLTEVMERIYFFLQTNNIENGDAKKVLANTPCILVESGKKFILPRQAVLELYEDLQIRPFLYGIPVEFGRFHSLFQRLGCSKSVTIVHYAMVLDLLHNKCHSSKLDPNEVKVCIKAVKGFFDKLQEDDEEVNAISQLYLPGISPSRKETDGNANVVPLNLYKSSELIFNDVSPDIRDRLYNFRQILLLDPRQMNVYSVNASTNYKELMMKLPESLRPKMLSSIVKENISSPSFETISSTTITQLKQQLSSPQFFYGIVRLIRDENCRLKRNIDDTVFESIKKRLCTIGIFAVNSLKTSIFCDGNPIPESEAEVPYIVKKTLAAGEEISKVYVNVATGTDTYTRTILLVSGVVKEVCFGLLGESALLISHMLSCSLNDIQSLLDTMGVRPDDSLPLEEVEILPEPGSFIPQDEHHLLNDDFEEFEPGDYVGFELHDPSLVREGGDATYIYAIIIEEVASECNSRMTRRYRINIGNGQERIVDATDLYKFHRLTESSSNAIVLRDTPRQPPNSRSRQRVFDEISDLLEEAWTLPEDKRRKIVKRMYLRWHPDKNIGDEEFCKEVCQHIQSEVSRLERGEPRGSKSTRSEAGNQDGSYGSFFNSWAGRAREHNTQRREYRGRPRHPKNNPQPGEARRWFKQAVADIQAASNDIIYERPSYEWACFKCHQVRENVRCNKVI